MNKVIKNSFYTAVWTTLLALNEVTLAAITFSNSNNLNSDLQWSSKTADNVIENWVEYIIWFLYLVAFIMMVYWAFNILTAAWDEEKVKKWKTILIQAVAWIIVIFIANSIISWVITGLFATGTNV